jgi:hypothetical protein
MTKREKIVDTIIFYMIILIVEVVMLFPFIIELYKDNTFILFVINIGGYALAILVVISILAALFLILVMYLFKMSKWIAGIFLNDEQYKKLCEVSNDVQFSAFMSMGITLSVITVIVLSFLYRQGLISL